MSLWGGLEPALWPFGSGGTQERLGAWRRRQTSLMEQPVKLGPRRRREGDAAGAVGGVHRAAVG